MVAKDVTPSRLCALPQELLIMVFSFSVPTVKDLMYHQSNRADPERNNTWPRRSQWIRDGQNLRLVCKAFSTHEAVLAAIFHNFYLYLDKRSMHNLADIASSPFYIFVRRVVFMAPQFSTWLAEEKIFAAAMRSEVKRDYLKKLRGTLPEKQLQDAADYLAQKYLDKNLGADVAELRAHYDAGLVEQNLVRNTLMREVGGRYLSRLTNMKSVQVWWTDGSDAIDAPTTYWKINSSDEITRTPPPTHPDDKTYMEKRHANTKIKGPAFFTNEYHRCQHMDAIMRTLFIADVKTISELVLCKGARLPRTFAFDNLTSSTFSRGAFINFERLKSLELDLNSAQSWTNSTSENALLPILSQATDNLCSLTISCSEASRDAYGIVDPILRLHFPKLKEFQLSDMRSSGRVLARFINNHDYGISWSLQTLQMRRRQWVYVLHALQLRKVKGSVSAVGMDEDGYKLLNMKPKWSRPQRKRHHARTLEEYIEGKVPWKKEWTALFGQAPTEAWIEDDAEYSDDGEGLEDGN